MSLFIIFLYLYTHPLASFHRITSRLHILFTPSPSPSPIHPLPLPNQSLPSPPHQHRPTHLLPTDQLKAPFLSISLLLFSFSLFLFLSSNFFWDFRDLRRERSEDFSERRLARDLVTSSEWRGLYFACGQWWGR